MFIQVMLNLTFLEQLLVVNKLLIFIIITNISKLLNNIHKIPNNWLGYSQVSELFMRVDKLGNITRVLFQTNLTINHIAKLTVACE